MYAIRSYYVQLVQRAEEVALAHLPAATPQILGDVAVAAVQVAAFRGIHVDRGQPEAEAQVLHLLGEIRRLLAVGLGQGRIAAKHRGQAGLLDQGPEGGVRVHQGHGFRSPLVQNLQKIFP